MCVNSLDVRHYMRIVLVAEQEWLGTAGAVVSCLWAHPELSRLAYILVMNGDVVCHYPFSSLISTYKSRNCACLLTHFSTRDPSQYGLLKLTREDGSSAPSLSELSDRLSLSFSSKGSELSESLSVGDGLLSSFSFAGSAESAGILSEEPTDASAEGDSVASASSMVTVRQVMRIRDYGRIHRSGTSIARVATPHRPSSPAGLRVNGHRSNGARSRSGDRPEGGTCKESLGPQLDLSYGQVSLAGYSSRHLRSLSKQVASRTSARSSSGSTIRLGKVSAFIEKPCYVTVESQQDRRAGHGVSYANAGIYVINPALLLSFPVPCSMEQEVFPALLARKLDVLSFYVGTERTWSDMGTIAGFIRGCQLLNGVPAFDQILDSSAQLGSQAHGTMLKSSLRGNVTDDAVRISSGAHVTNCVIYGSTVVPPGMHLEGCIVCSGKGLAQGKHYYNKIIP
ncbi:Mannose-1-phosphate guanyltransferase [Giardia lamblia P15]|uniref:Mannose-1-phosphate guanyltransferase n=1 Tax=Giardia intestinalis (strain P15) TaxID=658858 RepID=E1EYN7_GIAIA|nr:Mannose-1-phosphate guanyltransferase [Giardia lamblia P15]